MAKRQKARGTPPAGLPTRDDILRHIADNPGAWANARSPAPFRSRARTAIALKQILAEMEQEGLLARKGKRLERPGELAPCHRSRHHGARPRRRPFGAPGQLGRGGGRPCPDCFHPPAQGAQLGRCRHWRPRACKDRPQRRARTALFGARAQAHRQAQGCGAGRGSHFRCGHPAGAHAQARRRK